MNIHWIIPLYNTPTEDIDRLKDENTALDNPATLHFPDNTGTTKGYAEAINSVLRELCVEPDVLAIDAIIISNPDISLSRVTSKDIEELVQYFDVGGFAMEQHGVTYFGGELDTWRMSGGLISTQPTRQYQSVDFVSGSLMIIKTNVFEKIGFFDESYGMYYEDVDFCIRARNAGCTVRINTQRIYKHFETSDSNPQKKHYLSRNRLKILLKYGSWKQKLYELIRIPKTLYEYIS